MGRSDVFRILLAIIITVLAFVGSYVRVGGDRMLNPPPAPVVLIPPVTVTAPCMEDDECWDCQSMGNMICGGERP